MRTFCIIFSLYFFSATIAYADVEVDVLNFIPIKDKDQISASEIDGYFVVKLSSSEIHINRASISAVIFYKTQTRIYLSGPAWGGSNASSALAIPTTVMSKKQILNLVKGKSSWW